MCATKFPSLPNPEDSGKKKEPKPKVLGPDILRWGGGFPREGVGAESSVCPSKPGKPNFFAGIPRDLAGISRRCKWHYRQRPTFFCASFFPFFTLSAPSFPRQFSSPKSSLSGTSDLLFLVEKRQPPGAGFWGRFWTRSPHRKKRKILFFWRAEKGEEKNIFELIMHFIADTDTDDENYYFGINFSLQMQTQLFFAVLRGPHRLSR